MEIEWLKWSIEVFGVLGEILFYKKYKTLIFAFIQIAFFCECIYTQRISN